jgi:long-chain acyl-CoA synthetase
VHVFINRFTVTGDMVQFKRILDEIIEYVVRQPGFRSHRLFQSSQDSSVYVEIAEWDNAAAHKHATADDGFRDAVREIMKLTKAQADTFVVVAEHEAAVVS